MTTDDEERHQAAPNGVGMTHFSDSSLERLERVIEAISTLRAGTIEGALAQMVATYAILSDLRDNKHDEREQMLLLDRLFAITYSVAGVLEKHGGYTRDDFGGGYYYLTDTFDPHLQHEVAAQMEPALRPVIARDEKRTAHSRELRLAHG